MEQTSLHKLGHRAVVTFGGGRSEVTITDVTYDEETGAPAYRAQMDDGRPFVNLTDADLSPDITRTIARGVLGVDRNGGYWHDGKRMPSDAPGLQWALAYQSAIDSGATEEEAEAAADLAVPPTAAAD